MKYSYNVETEYLFVEIVCRERACRNGEIYCWVDVLLNNWIEEIAGVVM